MRTNETTKIQVLNFATFHMGSTSDAISVEFDERSSNNQEDANDIAARLTEFAPTIICVESSRENDEELNRFYQRYLEDHSQPSTYHGKIGLLAFEVGRLCGVKKLHGIDHRMGYNYRIGEEIENAIDPAGLEAYYANPLADTPALDFDEDSLPLLEKMRLNNHPAYLDYLIAINADMLAFAGTEEGFEGADEAAKYYQRNLRIYSNLNRIRMTKGDRVLIVAGGSHTAFLREFMSRSIKFGLVSDSGLSEVVVRPNAPLATLPRSPEEAGDLQIRPWPSHLSLPEIASKIVVRTDPTDSRDAIHPDSRPRRRVNGGGANGNTESYQTPPFC